MSKLFFRSSPLTGFRQTVRELGGDPEELIKEAGLDPLVLDDMEMIIPRDTFLRVLNIAAEKTGCEYFGIMLSKHLDMSVFGPVGLLFQHSDTVGDALHRLIQHAPTRFQGEVSGLQVEGELASLFYTHLNNRDEELQGMMLSAGLSLMLMKSLCGENWRPVEYHTNFERPKFANILIQYLKAPIRFGRERNEVFFNASDLNIKIPKKFGNFERYLQPLMEEGDGMPGDIVNHTVYLIRILLPEGKCNLENISALLYTSDRSLQRNLKARGTSFRQLVDRVRKSIAHQQLHHSNLSISQLAYLLGYTELSAFTRSFKRWFGEAPSKWKSK